MSQPICAYARHEIDTLLFTMKTLLTLLVSFGVTFQATAAFPDLLVSVNEFTGGTNAPRYMGFYQNGIFMGGYYPPIDQHYMEGPAVRDLVQSEDGTIWIFNGTFSPTLWEISPEGVHTLWTIDGWSLVNQTMRGGIALSDNYLFLTDNNTAGDDEDDLLIRMDVKDMSYERFGLDPNGFYTPFDLAVSDDQVYTLDTHGGVWVHDITTLELLRTFDLPYSGDYFGIDVSGGYVYTSGYDFGDSFNLIKKFTLQGVLVDELIIPRGGNLGDIDVNDDTGEIAVGTTNSGEVILTTTDLNDYTSFRATESRFGGGTFVAFPVVPEPTSLGLLFVGSVFMLVRRPR